jgi:threonylcarbamoyladenosine tRNA methylthiotransferase MtaB
MTSWAEAGLKDKPSRPRFIIRTLGCKVNQVESESIISDLKQAGWHHDTSGLTVAACIINTCSVTGKGAMQSRQAVRRCIRNHPDALIVVTGCHAQTDPGDIQNINGVHLVIGNSHKDQIQDIISAAAGRTARPPEESRLIIGDIMRHRVFSPVSPGIPGNRSRPFVKIQDGCNTFCTYCIVPYARGKSRSMPEKSVLDQIQRIHSAGFHEAVLTGIHLGTYGEDLDPGTTLLELLEKIIDNTALPRIRLSSIESKELSPDIIRLAADSSRLCRHFHVPLQSGDNDILKRMNRPYTREEYRRLILDIRSRIPDCGIGADVLVGFPGETDKAFENTCDLISELPVTYLHVFPFSPRKGTPAFVMPDRISPEVIKQRCRILRRLGQQKKEAFYTGMVGKTAGVIPEQKQSDGFYTGVTSQYIPVTIDGPVDPDDGIARVQITEVMQNSQGAGLTCKGIPLDK